METVGRRVRVRDAHGDRICVLAGRRAVVGDRVRWVKVPGGGGKLVGVEKRDTYLRRVNHRGKEQVLAANLRGLVIVDTGCAPKLNPVLLDRFLVAARRDHLEPVVCINKTDLGIPDDVKDNIAARADLGIKVLTTSALTGEGIEEFRAFLHDHPGTWTLVGRSGVGKTSLVRKLLPDIDVGPVGELSEYWGTGRHTTTRSCIFPLTDQCGIVDSPGIRQFVPGGLEQEHLFRFFPSIDELICKYRNCQHRPNEDGCVAESQVAKSLLSSYRTLLEELIDMTPRP